MLKLPVATSDFNNTHSVSPARASVSDQCSSAGGELWLLRQLLFLSEKLCRFFYSQTCSSLREETSKKENLRGGRYNSFITSIHFPSVRVHSDEETEAESIDQ